jgi:hypothetical protein
MVQFQGQTLPDEDDAKKEVTRILTETVMTMPCSIMNEWLKCLMQ